MDARICDAIAHRRLLMFAYGGAVRVVEPHFVDVFCVLGETVA